MTTPTPDLSMMILEQLVSRGITNKAVLGAFAKVDRRRFVLPEYAARAYEDGALPIRCGQTISQPYIVAIMTESILPTDKSKVLEIGTGSGYQTAILAEIVQSVYTVELIPDLHEKAKALLSSLGYKNIHAIRGDGYSGYAEDAPYDAIVVTAAPPSIPPILVAQLAPGGKMILPVGSGSQILELVTKKKDGDVVEDIFPVIFVPMKKSADRATFQEEQHE
jgi:protein-L-isoaspartate(D-aspartate) O-methyltransferase